MESQDNYEKSKEETTWREGILALGEAQFRALEDKFLILRETLTDYIQKAETKAETANATMGETLKLKVVALNDSISRVEENFSIAHLAAAQIASESDILATVRQTATTDMMHARLLALTDLIDLRSGMNDMAITKAEQATERRFDAISELRSIIVTDYVTRVMLEGKVSAITDLQAINAKQIIRAMKTQMISVAGMAVVLIIVIQFASRWLISFWN